VEQNITFKLIVFNVKRRSNYVKQRQEVESNPAVNKIRTELKFFNVEKKFNYVKKTKIVSIPAVNIFRTERDDHAIKKHKQYKQIKGIPRHRPMYHPQQ
jgi:hypothetical protein